jgi:hypothetical protein
MATNHFFPSLSLIFITKITNHFERTDKLKVGGKGTYRYTLETILLCDHFPFPSGALVGSGQHNDDEGKVIVH